MVSLYHAYEFKFVGAVTTYKYKEFYYLYYMLLPDDNIFAEYISCRSKLKKLESMLKRGYENIRPRRFP